MTEESSTAGPPRISESHINQDGESEPASARRKQLPEDVEDAEGGTRSRSHSQERDEIPLTDAEPRIYRSFNPYGQPRSVREINETVRSELVKAHPPSPGFIYGFTHPDVVFTRLGTGPVIELDVIKIGRTDNVQRRMQQWRKQCKYQPRLVFAHAMPQHQRVERIIHHQLHNARLREHQGCAGCGARHTEWFQVDATRAEALVRVWQGFASSAPYNQFGELLPCWLDRLERVDLNEADCWSLFARGSTPVGSILPKDGDSERKDGPSWS